MGNKNSGRHSRYDKIQAGKLLELCTSWIVENFNTFTKDEKLKVVLTIAPKAISDKHEHTGLVPQTVSVVHNYVNSNTGTSGNGRITNQILAETNSGVEQAG